VKRNILSMSIGLVAFLSFLFVYNVVGYFHSPTKPESGLAVIVMLGVLSAINWAVVFKSSTDARNNRLDALDEKLNRLLEQQER